MRKRNLPDPIMLSAFLYKVGYVVFIFKQKFQKLNSSPDPIMWSAFRLKVGYIDLLQYKH